MDKNEQTYKIDIPIYVTLPQENTDPFPFEIYDISQSNLIDQVKEKIQNFNISQKPLSRNQRNKTSTKNVTNVKCIDIELGDDKAILLQATLFQSNLYDKFVEGSEKTKLKNSDKYGSENNFFLLYPHVFGGDKTKFQWIILLYIDPNKDNANFVSSIKMVLKILNISPVHIKPDEIIDKLTKTAIIPQIAIKLFSFKLADNNVDYELDSYMIENNVTKIKDSKFENVPSKFANIIIKDRSFTESFKRRIVKITTGKQEIKFEQSVIEENSEKISELAEEIFNFSKLVTQEEVEQNVIYEVEFIKSKLQPILENYLKTYNVNK